MMRAQLLLTSMGASAALVFGAAAPRSAAAQDPAPQAEAKIEACAVPGSRTLYRADQSGACAKAAHEKIGWNQLGPKGDKGDKGDPGEAGPAGPKGDKGDPCSSSDAACRGPKGDAGPPGPKGDQGIQGIQGPPGVIAKNAAGAFDLGNDVGFVSVRASVGGEPIPASGPGTRLMWYAGKAAFRAGATPGAEWDDANVGILSVGMGWANVASGKHAVALGGTTKASGFSATALGDVTVASGNFSTAMGNKTVASGQSSVAMGEAAKATGHRSFAAGNGTQATHESSVAIGAFSTATNDYAVAIGGSAFASGRAAVALGNGAVASGVDAFAWGNQVTAGGANSIAMGSHASTGNLSGAIVFGDGSGSGSNIVKATSANQFMVRATGGVIFYTSADLKMGLELKAGGNSWGTVSDRNRKEFFRPVDADDILRRVAALPITSWSYKGSDLSRRYIGPMAQDFHALFGLGTDTTITTHDMDGVTLVSVQALEQRTRKLDRENSALREELAQVTRSLRALTQKYEDLARSLEARRRP